MVLSHIFTNFAAKVIIHSCTMKKTLLMIQMVVFLLGFMACSSENDNTKEMERLSFTQSDIIGVWASGDFFVSFGADGFYTAFIDDHFIDSGNYSISSGKNAVVTFNIFTKKNTEYHIKNLDDNSLVADIIYIQRNGQSYTKTMNFNKTTKRVVKERNGLVGTSWQGSKYVNGIDINYNAQITTYNFGLINTEYAPANNYPLFFFYIYYDNVIFYQLFNKNENAQVIEGWNDTADTYIVQQFESNVF